MAKPTEYLNNPGPAIIAAPFKLNEDDAQSNLGPGELPTLDYFYEHQSRLCPVVPLSFGSIAGAANIISAFPLPDQYSNPNVLFTTDFKMYWSTAANPTVMTEVTVAGGSTAISADGAINPFNVAVIGTTLYFSHAGLGPLRKWVIGAATYSDVAAPGSGYHAGVKYKPYYLATHLQRLLLGGDAAAGVGASSNDFIWSVIGSPEDFTSFGSGRTTINDTSDIITGIAVLYNKPVIFKSSNIVVAAPTGDALQPYSYERYNHGAQISIGCWAPYTLAHDGFAAFFLSRYGVVRFDGSQHTFVGKGVDNSILAAANFGGQQAAAIEVIGAFAGIYVKKLASAVASGNHPTRTYAITSILSSGATWLLNERTLGWSKMSSHFSTGIGSMFFDNATTPGIVLGKSGAVTVPCLCLDTQIMPSAFQPQLTIPTSMFQPSGNRKTIIRLGVEFQVISGVNHPAFTATPSVIMETSTIAGASQTLYPATNPSLAQPQFTWLNVIGDGFCPAVNIAFPAGDGVTTRYWPQISRLVVQYTMGDVQ